MKRLRDDDDAYVNSQIKRPLVSAIGESYAQPQVSGVGGGVETHKLTADDALSYLKAVKAMFQNQKEKYKMFLEVMKDFKSQRIDTSGVIARVKILFKGHNELIFGFNTFLPKDSEIKLVDDEDTPPKKRDVDFVEAISFVNKIKKRFQNDDRVYKSFLYTLNMYRQDNKDITEVNHEVEELFNEHPDLLEEFKRFLPNSAVASATHVPMTVRNSVPSDDELVATHVEKQQSRHQEMPKLAPKIEHDPNAERPEPVDNKKNITKVEEMNKNDGEKVKGDIRESDENNKVVEINNVHHQSRAIERRKSPRKVESCGVNSVLPSVHEKDALKSTFNQEFSFCEKVKERLQNPADYQAFLKCLNIYSTEVITKKELQSLVNDLLGKYPDLMDGFNKFFEHCESIDGLLAGIMSKREPLPMEVEETKSKEEKPKEKDRSKGKYSGKSIQELDLSDCERCTPSYRLLPEDYPIPSVSQRTELGAQLLNDRWVSVTSGSEDYSFTHMRRNQYEESLFRCEDDRFELDMLLESVRSTIKCVENVLNGIVDNSTAMSPIRIEDHFTAQHLRCIERIYGDHGLEMMELLRKNPSATLSVVLTRLKNKKEEWTKCLSDFNKVWGDVYARNHNKSLDHRSFYFKLQDLENMNTKSLVAEIKENKEKKQSLVYEYCNSTIHEDMSNIIEFSCKELCTTKDQLNKVKRIWTCLIQPMVGVVQPQHRNSEGTGYLNGPESTSADRPDSSSVNLVNGGKENSYLLEKEMRNTSLSDQARTATTASLQHGEVVRSVPLINGNAYHENHKIEKEEGELSPNGDFEDEIFPQEARFENHKEKSNISTSNCASRKQKDSRVLYGNDSFYVLFRLHQILYERLLSAKSSSTYARFMSALYNLLDGTCDNTSYEFDCQDIIGNHSYTLFTLDRLIYKLVKKLQATVSDDLDNKLLQFYEYQSLCKPDKYVDSLYYQNVQALLHDKNIYRFECSFGPTRLSIQLMNNINQQTDPTAAESSLCGLSSR